MISFRNPFFLFFLIPALIAFYYVYRHSTKQALLFSAMPRIQSIGRSWRIYAARILPAVFMTGLILTIIALARPRTTSAKINKNTNAIAIEMVLDCSGSMDALDMSKSENDLKTRLQAVKETFAEFVKQRPDDMIGLVTFGGYASTRIPLTPDHDLLLHVLKGIDVPRNSYDPQETATAIGDALATACARLENVKVKSKIIVLLSDGASNAGIIKPDDAIATAKKMKYKIYTIGVGSTGLAPILTTDMFGQKIKVPMQLEMDEELLKRAATNTYGKYFHVQTPEKLKASLEEIDKLEKTSVKQAYSYNYNELYLWFMIPGAVMIILASALNMLSARRIV